MAKIYDVYEDFKEEMRNISHFFNLEYHEKKISNEELIFNLLDQQFKEEKNFNNIPRPEDKKDIIADCVNLLQEQNKIHKKSINRAIKKEFKGKRSEDNNAEKVNSVEQKVEKEKVLKLEVEEKVEKKESPSVITFLQEEPKEEKKNFQIDFLPKKDVGSILNHDIGGKENCKYENLGNKVDHVFDFVKNNLEKTVDKVEKIDNIVNLFATIPEKKIENKEEVKQPVESKNFERKYFQNGKYVIDGVNLSTSVFVKKTPRENVIEKSKEEKKTYNEKKIEKEVSKNKNFKIDCNIDQNLLNGCYWPTQLS